MRNMPKSIMIHLAGVSLLFSCHNITTSKVQKTVVEKTKISLADTSPMKRIENSDSIILNIKYATSQNFTHQVLYPCPKCYLKKCTYNKLLIAASLARKQRLKLMIYDGYRPMKTQALMYKIVHDPAYVSDPSTTSKHTLGIAVDLTLADLNNHPLEMGGEFDDFSEVSHFNYSGLSNPAIENRKKLRTLMQQSGFLPYEKEWWHFYDAQPNTSYLNFEWQCN